MNDVLVYTVVFGEYDCHLAEMMVASLRASGFAGDVVVFTDRGWVMPQAACLDVTRQEHGKALRSEGTMQRSRGDGNLDYLLMRLMPGEFVDLTRYRFVMHVDTDVLFFANPFPTWMDAGHILVQKDCLTLADNVRFIRPWLTEDVLDERAGYCAGLVSLPQKHFDLLDEWRSLYLHVEPEARHRVGADQRVLNYLLWKKNYPVRYMDGVGTGRKVGDVRAVHYWQRQHDAMRVDFARYFTGPKGSQTMERSADAGQVASLLEAAQNCFRSRRFEQAEDLLGQLLRHDPRQAEAWFRLGLCQQQQNKLPEAVESFRNVIELQPEHVHGHTQLGILLARLGKVHEGESCLREALRLSPDFALAHNNLGVALAEQGRKVEALAAWQESVRLDPNYPEARFNLAVALAEGPNLEEAAQQYEKALELRPDYAEAYSNLGLVRVEQNRPAEAVVLLRQALRLRPDYVDAFNNLGLALVAVGRADESLTYYEEALRRRPNDADIHNNLGTALAALGRPEEALASYEQALRLRPGFPEVHWHQALTWLHTGDFTRGWPAYEWRWKRRRARPRPMDRPLWDGSDLTGKTILLWCEQGLGDTLQFIRYASHVKARGGTVIAECPSKLLPLLSTCAGVDAWVPERSELPPFDVHAPLLSLPGIFGTTLATIPAEMPYLSAAPDRIARWHNELRADSKRFKIGIAWQGNPLHRWDRHRSIPLECFAALARLPHVHLYSLQKGPGSEQTADFARRYPLTDLSSRLDEDAMFMDTAAVMKCLDLVITCDSSLAHLAGAVGVPVWLAVSRMTDWRWLSRREDSPWYPTMRLFRQKKLGDWDKVFRNMARAIQERAGSPARLSSGVGAP